MRKCSEDQQNVVNSSARIRIVKAAPGSGKTWLVAEILRREIEHWPSSKGGIAVLSFTNVARAEITRALGRELTHPHFVGTIDSFIVRYMLAHCGETVDAPTGGLRLIPAIVVKVMQDRQRWSTSSISVAIAPRQPHLNVFSAVIHSEAGAEIELWMKGLHGGMVRIPAHALTAVMDKKKAIWKRSGRVSHTDASFIAATMLATSHGTLLASYLVARFPLIIIDEAQDTGTSQHRIIQALLKQSESRGVIVGDPDQAIYGFSGARPDLFADFTGLPGSEMLLLAESRRCPGAVCDVAKHLSSSNTSIVPCSANRGQTYIAIYSDTAEVRALVQALSIDNCGEVRVLARSRAALRQLTSFDEELALSFRVKHLNLLHNATVHLRANRLQESIRIVESLVARELFETEAPTTEDFSSIQTDQRGFRRFCVDLLMRATTSCGSTPLTWALAARELLYDSFERIRPDPNRKKVNRVSTKQADLTSSCHDLGCWQTERQGGIRVLNATTIHAAKGETISTVILFIGSGTTFVGKWWSDKVADADEMRLAYVAVTRASERFILCIDRPGFDQLRSKSPQFVAQFDVSSVTEMITDVVASMPRASNPHPDDPRSATKMASSAFSNIGA